VKNLILISILSVSLAGCTLLPKKVQPEQVIVKQTEYVIKLPPAELLTLPAPVAPINVDTAKQSDVAAWMLQKEQYTRSLENMLKDIASFFQVQQKQLDDVAKTQNIQLQQAAAAQQAQDAIDASKKQVSTTQK
jgi:hypothetical protein